MTHSIREFTKDDLDGIKTCLVALQDFERMMDPHRIEGVKVAHAYLEHLLELCREARGMIFVVEIKDLIVGMVAVRIEHDPEHVRKIRRTGRITDLIVMEEHRHDGVIKELLEHAERYLQKKGITAITTHVLKAHAEGLSGFLRNGYQEYEIILRKRLTG